MDAKWWVLLRFASLNCNFQGSTLRPGRWSELKYNCGTLRQGQSVVAVPWAVAAWDWYNAIKWIRFYVYFHQNHQLVKVISRWRLFLDSVDGYLNNKYYCTLYTVNLSSEFYKCTKIKKNMQINWNYKFVTTVWAKRHKTRIWGGWTTIHRVCEKLDSFY